MQLAEEMQPAESKTSVWLSEISSSHDSSHDTQIVPGGVFQLLKSNRISRQLQYHVTQQV